MPYSEDIDLEELAERTHGFVGADLENLAKKQLCQRLEKSDQI